MTYLFFILSCAQTSSNQGSKLNSQEKLIATALDEDSPFCTPSLEIIDYKKGRSYGDPHIKTYDGTSYSFQTIGEFVVSQSQDRQFVIQTRQHLFVEESDVTLNVGVALSI